MVANHPTAVILFTAGRRRIVFSCKNLSFFFFSPFFLPSPCFTPAVTYTTVPHTDRTHAAGKGVPSIHTRCPGCCFDEKINLFPRKQPMGSLFRCSGEKPEPPRVFADAQDSHNPSTTFPAVPITLLMIIITLFSLIFFKGSLYYFLSVRKTV